MTDFYNQCKLQRENEMQTSWIPSSIARVGLTVKLKEEDGTWDENWRVIEVGTKLPWEQVRERSQDYKRTRKASDV